MMRIIEAELIEALVLRWLAELPVEFEAAPRFTPRHLWLYTALPVNLEYLQESVCSSVLEILPKTQDDNAILKALPETVVKALVGTLTGTLTGTRRYLKTYPKQAIPGRGERWSACLFLEKVIALGTQAIKLGKAAFIIQDLFDSQRSEPQFVSVRAIQYMMLAIDSCSIREALDIKARLERMQIATPNGHTRTHGSEVIRVNPYVK